MSLDPASLQRGVVIPATNIDRARIHEDLHLIAEHGIQRVRLGLDWEWVQEAAGTVTGDAIEFYLGVAQTAKSLELALEFTLLERSVPKWFENEGGFGDAKWALHWFPRWVELCADTFGDVVQGWVPIDNPLGVANRLFPNEPRRHGDVLDTVAVAWRDAWRILRGGPPVSTAFALEIVRPVDQTIPAEHAAKRLDQIRWRLWLQGLADGIISIPGRADKEIADLAGSCDVLGLIVRHERDTLGLLHRAAEQGPDRPVAVTFLLPAGADADREPAVSRFIEQAAEAASGMKLDAMSVSPLFDTAIETRGLITQDRELKDSARAWFGRER